MKTFLFFFFVLFFTLGNAQTLTREQFLEDSARIMRPKLVRPQLRYDSRLTFFDGQTLALNGFDAGVLLKDKMRLTLGYYKVQDDLDAIHTTPEGIETINNLRVEFGSINTEIIYSNTRYFSLGMPLEIGFGQAEIKEKNALSKEVIQSEQGLLGMAHFGLSATFKPIRWIGLKGMVGYRKQVYNQLGDFNFDGLFTSLGLNVDFREIIKDIQMFNLKKKYKRGNNIENAVDLITD